MRAAVVGLGKIGLPLAVQIASKGHQVIGADVSADVVASVLAGVPPFPNEAQLDERLQDVIGQGLLTATTSTAEAVAEADVVLVVVPLVVDSESRPDFRILDAATAAIAPALRRGALVSYETTLPVHTTRDRFVPALEAGSGLRLGDGLLVCHSPERVFSGRVFADLRRYPKLVGGVDAESAERAVDFYAAALDFDDRPDLPRPNGVWDLGSAEAAELTKLVETTYRDVNIALANEFAQFADGLGLDVHGVIDAANSQPFSHVHRPGVAVGGHCIPVYPRFYLSGHRDAVLPRAARGVNEAMPDYTAGRLELRLGGLQGVEVVVLGVAYRGGVKETAFSGAFPLVAALEARGATVRVHDPLYSDAELAEMGLSPAVQGDPATAAVLQADHADYRVLDRALLPRVRTLLDGRGFVTAPDWPGVDVVGIGAPPSAAG